MPTLKEKYKVPQFDVKGEADTFFKDLDVPVTFVCTSFPWENLLMFGMGAKPNEQDALDFVLPTEDRKLPSIAAEDMGACLDALFQKGPELAGRTVGLAREHLTGGEIARTLKEVLGQEVVSSSIPAEVYRTFNFPGAAKLANMFQFMRDFSPGVLRREGPRVHAGAEPGRAITCTVAGAQQGSLRAAA